NTSDEFHKKAGEVDEKISEENAKEKFTQFLKNIDNLALRKEYGKAFVLLEKIKNPEEMYNFLIKYSSAFEKENVMRENVADWFEITGELFLEQAKKIKEPGKREATKDLAIECLHQTLQWLRASPKPVHPKKIERILFRLEEIQGD
ncbi:MAG: hypothetical protein Q7K42_02435, partial [Candidatus Diapherotrites archaeon]|nr:hypothetical protein [Candidatus Diapherotrites archaeon]